MMNDEKPRKPAESPDFSLHGSVRRVLWRDREALRTPIGRRAFLRYIEVATGIAFIARVATDVATELFLPKEDFDPEIMRQAFGLNTTKAGSVVPADKHPFKDPPPGMNWYPTELACAQAFQARFTDNLQREIVSPPDDLQFHQEDTLYAFGSQVSNRISRYYLRSPWEEPVSRITQPDWHADLRWNLHTPANASVDRRQQFGDLWITKKHVIIDFNGRERTASDHADYLLMTVIPRYSPDKPQRVFVFGGIHAAGTQATKILFLRPPSDVINYKYFFSDTRNLKTPYYQALFEVSVDKDEQGERVPRKLEYIESAPLKIAPSPVSGKTNHQNIIKL